MVDNLALNIVWAEGKWWTSIKHEIPLQTQNRCIKKRAFSVTEVGRQPNASCNDHSLTYIYFCRKFSWNNKSWEMKYFFETCFSFLFFSF